VLAQQTASPSAALTECARVAERVTSGRSCYGLSSGQRGYHVCPNHSAISGLGVKPACYRRYCARRRESRPTAHPLGAPQSSRFAPGKGPRPWPRLSRDPSRRPTSERTNEAKEVTTMSSSTSQRMAIGAFLLRRLEEASIRHLLGVPGDYKPRVVAAALGHPRAESGSAHAMS
jgi:hypothetical protein